MTQTDSKIVPTLTFYKDFPEEWERFSPEMLDALSAFFERLQSNPYDPSIIERSEKLGGYYGTPVGPLIVFWKVANKRGETGSLGLVTQPDSIHILAVERANGR
ncbi:MAG: hypothetical protein WBC78_20175 [Candidatus Sulfotelmatobacter sp.]